MIIIGYQGIGKSTLANQCLKYIDLESSNFFVDGKRADDWFKPYCNIAENLSRQGYYVFVSSHAPVRKRLLYTTERVLTITPDATEEMKEVWIDRLKKRYESTQLDKDLRSLKFAESHYFESINDVIDTGFQHVSITTKEYDLSDLIEEAEKRWVGSTTRQRNAYMRAFAKGMTYSD